MSALAPDAPLLTRLCDDAAVFPPGNMPLEQAVPAYVRHTTAAHAALVGPFVLAAKDLGQLAELTGDLPEASLDLALTAPLPKVADAVEAAGAIPAVRVVALEVALPEGTLPTEVVPALGAALTGRTGIAVSVEAPRDERRDGLLEVLSGGPFAAKFRTGGVRAELYPDEEELAASVLGAVRMQVPFKATAGLHHAIRHTDPETGFEQHGFLNLLTATDAALRGAEEPELVELLAERDHETVAHRAGDLDPAVREAFRSFGTCSITDPATELADLGILDPDATKDLT